MRDVLAGSVVAHGGAWVSMAGGGLDVAEVDAGVEHGGDVGLSEHVRGASGRWCCRPWPGGLGGGECRSGATSACPHECRGWDQRQPGLRPLARWPDRPLAGAARRRACRLCSGRTGRGDRGPQTGRSRRRLLLRRAADAARPSMATRAKSLNGRVAAGGQEGLELAVAETEGWGLGGHVGAADVVSGSVLEDSVDDAGPVEPGQYREPPRLSIARSVGLLSSSASTAPHAPGQLGAHRGHSLGTHWRYAPRAGSV